MGCKNRIEHSPAFDILSGGEEMQKYDAIENGIARNDIKALREAIGSICYTNRDFSNGEFFEVVSYVESKGIQLKDAELIGTPTISSQKNEFTDEDFAKAVFVLKKNFCDERIDDVKTIGEKLYGKKSTVDKKKTPDRDRSERIEHNSKPRAGTSPNLQRHQQNNKIMMTISLVAIIMVLVVVVLLVIK